MSDTEVVQSLQKGIYNNFIRKHICIWNVVQSLQKGIYNNITFAFKHT